MIEQPEISPTFDTELPGFELAGRGSTSAGWSRDPSTSYRCAQCGSVMPASQDDFFECECGAMFLDVDYHRFGSQLGDHNIFVYRKTGTPEA